MMSHVANHALAIVDTAPPPHNTPRTVASYISWCEYYADYATLSNVLGIRLAIEGFAQ